MSDETVPVALVEALREVLEVWAKHRRYGYDPANMEHEITLDARWMDNLAMALNRLSGFPLVDAVEQSTSGEDERTNAYCPKCWPDDCDGDDPAPSDPVSEARCQTPGCGHSAGHHRNYTGRCGYGNWCACTAFTPAPPPATPREELDHPVRAAHVTAWHRDDECEAEHIAHTKTKVALGALRGGIQLLADKWDAQEKAARTDARVAAVLALSVASDELRALLSDPPAEPATISNDTTAMEGQGPTADQSSGVRLTPVDPHAKAPEPPRPSPRPMPGIPDSNAPQSVWKRWSNDPPTPAAAPPTTARIADVLAEHRYRETPIGPWRWCNCGLGRDQNGGFGQEAHRLHVAAVIAALFDAGRGD